MVTVGEALVHRLTLEGVEVVFGIPGVHTIELYRGLAASGIRHVTPRHEQGAGFMADGYARVSGKPGVAFVITGPGLTNILTPMAQARADSIPMLVVCGVNRTGSQGRGLGLLHELPDQLALAQQVAVLAEQVATPDALAQTLDRAFERLSHGRPGPVLLEIPTDVMPLEASNAGTAQGLPTDVAPDVAAAARRLAQATRPVIIAGGGARTQSATISDLAERLDAPVVQTANARGIMHAHSLVVPASPSLPGVRALLQDADLVLALGTEFGPTDYDVYDHGGMPLLEHMIRVDICAQQLTTYPTALALKARTETVLPKLCSALPGTCAGQDGARRAQEARVAARNDVADLAPGYPDMIKILGLLRRQFPGSVFVGDSTQAVYAGNLYYDHDRPGGWFNGATGFGALGFAIPAAIGASLADPGCTVVAIMGDGGAQFTQPEMIVAVEAQLPILFVVWNNAGYKEIGDSMAKAGITVIGCDPRPPRFDHVARACGLTYIRSSASCRAIEDALSEISPLIGPTLLEIDACP